MFLKREAYDNLNAEDKNKGIVATFSFIEIVAMATEFICGLAYLYVFSVGLPFDTFTQSAVLITLGVVLASIIAIQSVAYYQAFTDLIVSKMARISDIPKWRGYFWAFVTLFITGVLIYLNKKGDKIVLDQVVVAKSTTTEKDSASRNDIVSDIDKLDREIASKQKFIKNYKCVGCEAVVTSGKLALKEPKYSKRLDEQSYIQSVNKGIDKYNASVKKETEAKVAEQKTKELKPYVDELNTLVERRRVLTGNAATMDSLLLSGLVKFKGDEEKVKESNNDFAGYIAIVTQLLLMLSRGTILYLKAKEGKVYVQKGLILFVSNLFGFIKDHYDILSFKNREKGKVKKAEKIYKAMQEVDDFIDKRLGKYPHHSDVLQILDDNLMSINDAFYKLRNSSPPSVPEVGEIDEDEIKDIILSYETLYDMSPDDEKKEIKEIINSYKALL